MDVTIEAGRVVSGTQKTFVRNRLVVIYPQDNPAGITQLPDLAKPGLKLILAAKEVPVGQYSLDFLNKAITDTAFSPTYMDEVLKNVVSYEDNVKLVLTKISLGEGDAGIVYTSDITGDSADQVGRLDISDNLNTVASYPLAVVNDSAAPKQAQAFVDFVLSATGQEIFTRYGFIPISAAGAAAPTPAAAAQLVVTDALGNSVSFAQPPQRIAVAGKGIFMLADALYMFPEAKTRVTTLPRGGQSTADFLALVDSGYNQKTFFEGDAGPEQIAATQPEAIVLKSVAAEKLGRPLEQLGLPVVYVDLETPEQYFKDIATLGQLFGNAEQAKTITGFYQSRLDRVSQAMQGLTDDQNPRVLVLQYRDKGGEVAFNVAPASWIQTTMVTLAGGQPVWTEAAQGGGWAVVNFEQIAAWNPDKIFVINYTGDVAETVANLKADPQWQGLKAVQSDQLYAFPKDYYSWDQPDTRWIWACPGWLKPFTRIVWPIWI
jgi:iron complex transport system substrate-binding protein